MPAVGQLYTHIGIFAQCFIIRLGVKLRVEDAFTERQAIRLLLPEENLIDDGAWNNGGTPGRLHARVCMHR